MKVLFALFFLFINISSLAQEEEKIKEIVENLAERNVEEEDFSELSENLAYYKKHPIDLNKATASTLKVLMFLSPLQISSLLHYLKNNGRLIDVLELQAIPGFDLETVNRILPFVKVDDAHIALRQLHLKNLTNSGHNNLIMRYARLFEQQKGFRDLSGSRYLGTADKFLIKYRYTLDEAVSVAVLLKKDAGEYWLKGTSIADFLSAHLALFKIGRLKKLVLGDYSLQFGQGLSLWSGFGFGKGADVTSVAAKDLGIKPYTSTNESSYFRGLATTLNIAKNLDFSTFISYRKIDASLKRMADSSYALSNIQTSGLHRTKTELQNKSSVGQMVYGGTLQYLSNNLNFGLLAYHSRYQHQFITGTALYNKYSFTGKTLNNVGLHYNYTYKNVYFYGEVARSIQTGWAMIQGAMANLTPKLAAVLLARNYDRNYHCFFSKAVGEATETANERGIYLGLNFNPWKGWTFSTYADYFRFPWLKYRIDSASAGYDLLGQLTYMPNKIFKSVLRYKRELKQQNPESGGETPGLQNVLKQNYRLEFNWRLDKKYNFQQRTEIVRYQKGIKNNEFGFLIYQDFGYSPMSAPFSGNIRLAYFNTASYNSRIYAYEDDVLYAAGSGNYAGKGIRSFLNIRYKAMRKMDLWARYALFIYRDVEKIGSGLDEIEGNKKTELKLQIRYQF